MPGKETTGQKEVKDEYSDAFEEASQGKTPEELEAEARETGRADGDGADPDKQQLEGQAGEGEAAEGGQGGEEPDYKKLYEDEHQKYSSLQGMYNKTQEENEQLKKTKEPAKEETAKVDEEGDVSAEELLKTLALENDEDVKFMLEEYDALARPVQKIVAKALSKMKPDKQQQITPEQIQEIVGREVHNATIKIAHADFDDLVGSGKLRTYVDGLPDGEDKTRYNQIYQQGTADQVISLIDSYKESQGIKTQDGNGRSSKILNLTAVPKKHTPVNVSRGTGKAENYADAFDEAAAASGKR